VITPEQRYILACLAEKPGHGLVAVRNDKWRTSYMLVGSRLTDGAYFVNASDVKDLVRLGYLAHSPEAGGAPVITSAGLIAATQPATMR
jgi:hypothetical protein